MIRKWKNLWFFCHWKFWNWCRFALFKYELIVFFSFMTVKFRYFFYDCVWISNFFESEKMNVYFKKTNWLFLKIHSKLNENFFTFHWLWKMKCFENWKKIKKKSIINNLTDLNEFRLFMKLLFFWMFVLSCFKLLFSSV